MRKYRVNFYSYIGNVINEKIFFSNTIKFINVNNLPINQPIINNLLTINPSSTFTIKGGKNEIDTTMYNLQSGKLLFILTKDYE